MSHRKAKEVGERSQTEMEAHSRLPFLFSAFRFCCSPSFFLGFSFLLLFFGEMRSSPGMACPGYWKGEAGRICRVFASLQGRLHWLPDVFQGGKMEKCFKLASFDVGECCRFAHGGNISPL